MRLSGKTGRKLTEKKMNNIKEKKCVICHGKIFPDTTVLIDEDKYYVVGAGYLCPDCYNEIYSKKGNNDIHI